MVLPGQTPILNIITRCIVGASQAAARHLLLLDELAMSLPRPAFRFLSWGPTLVDHVAMVKDNWGVARTSTASWRSVFTFLLCNCVNVVASTHPLRVNLGLCVGADYRLEFVTNINACTCKQTTATEANSLNTVLLQQTICATAADSLQSHK